MPKFQADKLKTRVIRIMVSFHSIFEKGKRLFVSQRNRYLTLGCLIGLGLFFLLRGCGNSSFDKEYYIGQDSRWSSLNLLGKERNLSAFNHSLLTAIAKQENFRIRVVDTSPADLMTDLEKGRLQGILIALQPNYLNKNRVVFSEPYFLFGPVLIIPSTAPLEGWNEKAKKMIAIQANSHYPVNFEQDPSIQIKPYTDILTALSDLNGKKIDGAVFPAIPAYTYVTTFYKNELKISTLPLTDEGIRLVALNNKEGQLLIKRFNEGLADLKEKGTYNKILGQWSLINSEQLIANPSENTL